MTDVVFTRLLLQNRLLPTQTRVQSVRHDTFLVRVAHTTGIEGWLALPETLEVKQCPVVMLLSLLSWGPTSKLRPRSRWPRSWPRPHASA